MADQTVSVSNLPDSGSKEAVAFSLWKWLRNNQMSQEEQLALYVKCLQATSGYAPE